MSRTRKVDYVQSLVMFILITFAVVHSFFQFETYIAAFKEMTKFLYNLCLLI